jgi:predicted metal-dependent TIM-barrel fold hydrolase
MTKKTKIIPPELTNKDRLMTKKTKIITPQQNHEETTRLIIDKIDTLAMKYRNIWNNLSNPEYIEEFGENEFIGGIIGGKIEAFEECIKIIKEQIRIEQ